MGQVNWVLWLKGMAGVNPAIFKMKKVYYAHPVTHYGTIVEELDIIILQNMGFEVINPNSENTNTAYKEKGMQVFFDMIDTCDVLAFRSFNDGMIGAGVKKEIEYALAAKGLCVFELQRDILDRSLTVEQTRERIKQGVR